MGHEAGLSGMRARSAAGAYREGWFEIGNPWSKAGPAVHRPGETPEGAVYSPRPAKKARRPRDSGVQGAGFNAVR